jgi:hypothetical protein
MNGEYWITEGGDVMYADGDIGDYNHEAYVIQQAQSQVVQASDLDEYEYDRGEYVDWDKFMEDLPRHTYEELSGQAKSIEEKQRLRQQYELDPEVFTYRALKEMGIDDDTYAIATGFGDAREFAMKKWGWKRVQGTNVESWTLNPDDFQTIARGLGEIMEQEGVDDDSLQFHISVYSTGQSFDMTITELEQGRPNTINQHQASIDRQNQAMNISAKNYVNQLDRQNQHDYYKNKPLGDWITWLTDRVLNDNSF